MARKSRVTLKEYFGSGKTPTARNFADIMDSHLNIVDDEIYVKVIEDESGQEKYVGMGTPNPKEKLEVTGNIKAEAFKGKVDWNNIINMPDELIPSGVILMWSGDLKLFDETGKGKEDKRMKQWALCNGNNGTPDLRGRFVVGYDPGKAKKPVSAENKQENYGTLGNTGGSNTHRLTKAELPRHHHAARSMKNNGASIQIGSSGAHRHSYEKNKRTKRRGDGIRMMRTAHTDVRSVNSGSSSHTHGNRDFSGNVGNGAADGLGDQHHENRPPYLVLAYIMKLPS